MLTEEEILAAPEEDYMNDEQLAFFRQHLLEMRQSLEQGNQSEDEVQLDAERAADESDRATQEEQYWIQVRMKERETHLIRDIDKSLHRIRTGEYGFCEDTGDEIGIQRLLIRPTSRYTAEAQARRELQTRQYAAA
jgi:DnaK suppressor protein